MPTDHFRILICLLWLLVVAGGLSGMVKYEGSAGKVGETPRHWPPAARTTLADDRATLLMFAHPKCPCTRASLEELNRLLTHCRGEVIPHVLFFRPENAPRDWTHTDLRQSAEAIPGVIVEEDPDGKQAQRFGAETSGYVVVYDAHGELLFKGGITAGRGHAGDNAGANAIVSLLSVRSALTRQAPVFGCTLLNPNGAGKNVASLCTRQYPKHIP